MKIISHDRMLLLLCLTPLLLIILLKLVFPVFSHLVITRSGFLLEKYYSLIAITFVSIIPMLYGMVYAFVTSAVLVAEVSRPRGARRGRVRRRLNLLQEAGLEDESFDFLGIALDFVFIRGETNVLYRCASLQRDRCAFHLQILDDLDENPHHSADFRYCP